MTPQMRLVFPAILAFALTGCEAMSPDKPEPDGDLDIIEAAELTDVMLSLRDPGEAATYFRAKLAREPGNIRYTRGLATSLSRANRPEEAALVYQKLMASGEGTDDDRLLYAESLVKSGDMSGAEAQLSRIVSTKTTYKRALLEAIVADNSKNWALADDRYQSARNLTARPAAILNNWGMSKLARGDTDKAADLFQEAITFDPDLFQAKNNLVTARARNRQYKLPIIPMSEAEEAELMYNAGIIAVRQGDIDIARGLFESSIDTHPEHFEEATQALASLGGAVLR